MFINAYQLIVGCVKSGDLSPVLKIPKNILTPDLIPVLDYLRDYEKSYGSMPSMRSIEKRFDFFSQYSTFEFAVGVVPRHEVEEFISRQQNVMILPKLAELANLTRTGQLIHDTDLDGMRPLLVPTKVIDTTQPKNFAEFNGVSFRKKRIRHPYPMFNRVTGGFYSGELLVLAAKPGTGKTFVLLDWAVNLAKFGRRCMVISMEMSPIDIMSRCSAIVGHFNSFDLRINSQVAVFASTIAQKVYQSTYTGELIIPTLDERPETVLDVERLVSKYKPDILFVDSFYYLRGSDNGASGWESVTETTRALKHMSIRHQIPICLSTQLNREKVKTIEDMNLDCLAYSASIGMDTDIIFGMMQDDNPTDDYQIAMKLLKNRAGGGMSEVMKLQVDFETTRMWGIES